MPDVRQTPNGIPYASVLTCMRGERFWLYPKPHTPPEAVQAARRWLYRSFDVLSITIERRND